jgi:hypothetical protein
MVHMFWSHDPMTYLEEKRSSWGPSCVIRYSQILVSRKEYEAASQNMEEYRSKFPDAEADFTYQLAQIKWLKEKSKSAFEALVTAAFNVVDFPTAYLYTANQLINRARLEEARSLIEAALRIEPLSIEARRLLGWERLMSGQVADWLRMRNEIHEIKRSAKLQALPKAG